MSWTNDNNDLAAWSHVCRMETAQKTISDLLVRYMQLGPKNLTRPVYNARCIQLIDDIEAEIVHTEELMNKIKEDVPALKSHEAFVKLKGMIRTAKEVSQGQKT